MRARKIDLTKAIQLLHISNPEDRERLAESLAPDVSTRKFEATLKSSGFLKHDDPENKNVTRITNSSSFSDYVNVRDLSIYPLLTRSERVNWKDLMIAFAQDLRLRGRGLSIETPTEQLRV